MAGKIDLYTRAWCDLVFKGKNKEFGAYELRKSSGYRHLIAFTVVLLLCSLGLVVRSIVKSVAPKSTEHMVEVTTLANIKVEPAQPKEDVMKNFTPPPPPLKSTIKFTPPVIKKDEEVRDEDEIKTQQQLNQTDKSISIKDIQGTDEKTGLDVAELDQNKEITGETGSEKPYLVVEQMPEFPGGEEELYKYLGKSVNYPKVAQENGVSGTVFVAFVVGPDGAISDVKVARGFDKSCEEEAVRVVKSMPRWKSGKQNGKPVYVQLTLPVIFRLKN